MEDLINHYNKNNTYLNLYGGSFVVSLLTVFFFFILISYCFILIHSEEVRNDWDNQRCKPHVMPFAGIIQDTGDKTRGQYSVDNFKDCMTEIASDVVSFAIKPLMTITTNLLNLKKELVDDLKSIYTRLDEIGERSFNGVNNITSRIISKFGSVLVPIQNMIAQMRDTMNKVQGSMASVIYVMIAMINMIRDSF